MGQFGMSSRFLKMAPEEKSRAILLLLDHLELWDREERLRGARAVLYLAQVVNFVGETVIPNQFLFDTAAGKSACPTRNAGTL